MAIKSSTIIYLSLSLWFMFIRTCNGINITRTFTADYVSLRCPYTVDCSIFKAKSDPTDLNTCVCSNKETLYFKNDRFQCIGGKSGVSEGCDFFFNYYDNQIQAISLAPKQEYVYGVMTGGNACAMEIIGVELYGDDFKWKNISIDFEMQGSYVRIKENQNLLASTYSGQLLKFHIKCTSFSSGLSRNNCLIAKITGDKTWKEGTQDVDPCNPSVVQLSTPPVVTTHSPTTMKPTRLATTITTITKIKSEGSSDNTGLIAGVVAGLLVLIICVIILIICLLRRRRKQLGKKQMIDNDVIVDGDGEAEQYEEIPKKKSLEEIENSSYQTQLKMDTHQKQQQQQNNNEIYSNPDENYDTPNSAVYTSPYEEAQNKSEYNKLGAVKNDNKIKSRDPAQQYSLLKKKEMTQDEKLEAEYMTLEDEDQENYEPLNLKPGSPNYQRLSQYEDMQGSLKVNDEPQYMEANVSS